MREGKTKQILDGVEPGTIILSTKDVLTAGDAARIAEIPSIGVWKTTQAVNVFTLLKKCGVPTAFLRRLDERSILCADCDMLPIEFVVRRIGFGSYLRRHPGGCGAPRPLPDLIVERFHKHALIVPPASKTPELLPEETARQRYLHVGEWADGVHTDPYIEVGLEHWHLHSAKIPFEPGNGVHCIEAQIPRETDVAITETILLPAFRSLEQAWQAVETREGPVVLVDCKFEVGIRRSDGTLVLADVVDNDSWRIWPGGDPSNQLDKQNFRDDAPLSEIAEMYELVAELTTRFHR